MNIFENLRINKHKNNNEFEKSWTVADLVRAFNTEFPEFNIDRNKIMRIENGSQKPDKDILIAYSKVFRVSTDYLLGLAPHCKKIDENVKMICDYLGISDEATEAIRSLDYLDKLIFDKMIGQYSLLPYFTQNIKRILSLITFGVHATITLDENIKKYDEGVAILENSLNSSDIKSLLYIIVDNNVHNVIDNLIEDDELKDIFIAHIMESSVKCLSDKLPKLNSVDKTAKKIKSKDANKNYNDRK